MPSNSVEIVSSSVTTRIVHNLTRTSVCMPFARGGLGGGESASLLRTGRDRKNRFFRSGLSSGGLRCPEA